MKKSQLRKLIRESIKKLMLNENIPCQCFAGGQRMSCHDGPPHYNNYWVRHTVCCPVSEGGSNHKPHAMCHDRPCGSYDNTICFDVGGYTTGPGGGLGEPGLEPEVGLDTSIAYTPIKKPKIDLDRERRR